MLIYECHPASDPPKGDMRMILIDTNIVKLLTFLFFMKRSVIIYLILLILSLPVLAGAQAVNLAERLRIEEEEKLLVPIELQDKVWDFLYKNYVEDKEHLKKFDPYFNSSFADEYFTDTYFDTRELKLLDKNSSIRHAVKLNITAAEKELGGNDLMQIEIGNVSVSDGELQSMDYHFEVKYHKQVNDEDDKNPVLGIVKRSERDLFRQAASPLKVDFKELKPILTINDFRKKIYINRDDVPFLSISWDRAEARILWAKAEFLEIAPELSEITFTAQDEAGRKYMKEINARIIQEIKDEFPEAAGDLTPKYNKAFSLLAEKIPYLRAGIKYNELVILAAVVLVIILAAVIFLGAEIIYKRIRSL